jgi:hypothetical protein
MVGQAWPVDGRHQPWLQLHVVDGRRRGIHDRETAERMGRAALTWSRPRLTAVVIDAYTGYRKVLKFLTGEFHDCGITWHLTADESRPLPIRLGPDVTRDPPHEAWDQRTSHQGPRLSRPYTGSSIRDPSQAQGDRSINELLNPP